MMVTGGVGPCRLIRTAPLGALGPALTLQDVRRCLSHVIRLVVLQVSARICYGEEGTMRGEAKVHLSRPTRMCIRQSTAHAKATASSVMLTRLAGKNGGCARSAVVMGGRLRAENTSARLGRDANERSRVSRWRLCGNASFSRACLACCLACTQAAVSSRLRQHVIPHHLARLGSLHAQAFLSGWK